MDNKLKVYFAGPDVFRSNPQEHFDQIKKYCINRDIEPLFPFDTSLQKAGSIYQYNIDLLKKCDVVLANISCFRGPYLDPGVAFEIGYAKALNKPIVAYTNNNPIMTYKDRTTSDTIAITPEYPLVENFGLIENLMISYSCDFIRDSLSRALYNVGTYYKWIV